MTDAESGGRFAADGAGVLEGDVSAHRLQDFDEAGAGRVDADVGDGDIGAGDDERGDDREGG
ncbi:hypothetical protein GCM10007973_28960 [Polymorphobacter multimanifer]|nr:hypothetical protein GCM10007973_28960 [Polymorphobacter multimanifer]